jgi:hypothetical protein
MIKHKPVRMAAATLVTLFAVSGHAATTPISPALAACSKALVESIAKAETLPAYTVKAPVTHASSAVSLYDPNSFTVIAHKKASGELLAKATCKATPAGEIVSFKTITRS